MRDLRAEIEKLVEKWNRKKQLGIRWLITVDMSASEAEVCEAETARAAEFVDDLRALLEER